MWVLDKMLRRLVKRGQLIVIDYDGREYHYGEPDTIFPRPIRIRLTVRGAARLIARDPRLAMGEGFMDGWIVVEEGDVRDFAALACYNAPSLERQLKPSGLISRALDAVARSLDQINWKQRSRRNAEHTYNLSRRLYELFLDADRQYTCAYFHDPSESLEKAQLDKKAHIAAKLCLKPGMRVLDIGCGWGGMALYLHRHYDVDVLGVALAPDQIQFSRERAAEAGVSHRVKFELMDYRDVAGDFDRIVNVGLIEHLGPPTTEASSPNATTC